MALLTYDWRAPDPTGAVQAYLSGAQLGLREAALRQEAAENAQKRLQAAVTAQKVQQKADTDMALQLLQESRLNRAADMQAAYNANRMKNADAVTKARVGAYNRANPAAEPWEPLPVDGETPTAGPATTAATEAPAFGAGAAGDLLNFEANQGEGADMALSLAQKSPFARGADFMGTTAADRAGGEAQSFEEGIASIPTTMADGSLLESANAFGGDAAGGINPPAPVATSPDLLPVGGASDDLSTGLMAGNDPRSPADQVLSPAATRRVNLAGSTSGRKAAEAQLKVELSAAARGAGNPAAAKPLTRNFPDGTFRQWEPGSASWEILAEKPAKEEKPTVRNFVDGTTRQYNHDTNEWEIQASKPAPGEKPGAEDAAARAAQDQLIQRANHQRSIVADLEKNVFTSKGEPIVVEWPWEEGGKFYRKGKDDRGKVFKEEISKEDNDGMLARNARIQESAAKLAQAKAKLEGFESQIDGYDPTAAAPAKKSDAGKLYQSDGKSVKFAQGEDFAQSVQQAVDDGLITPDQGREALRKAGFVPKTR